MNKPKMEKRFYRPFFKEVRVKMGSQDKVARDLEITKDYLRFIENGYMTPGVELMKRCAKYFGEPIQKLFPDVFNI